MATTLRAVLRLSRYVPHSFISRRSCYVLKTFFVIRSTTAPVRRSDLARYLRVGVTLSRKPVAPRIAGHMKPGSDHVFRFRFPKMVVSDCFENTDSKRSGN